MFFTNPPDDKDISLINEEIINLNESRDFEYMVKSFDNKYYRIKSSHFFQTYEWEEVIIPHQFIELYLDSNLESKVKYAIQFIGNSVSSFNISKIDKYRFSRGINRQQFNYDDIDFGQVDLNSFIEIKYVGSDEIEYIIWCDQNKMFGWYPNVTFNHTDWITQLLG
jgi:hypothetical protein